MLDLDKIENVPVEFTIKSNLLSVFLSSLVLATVLEKEKATIGVLDIEIQGKTFTLPEFELSEKGRKDVRELAQLLMNVASSQIDNYTKSDNSE